MADFVLVHGAWHGGWCWARVAERLRAKGHRVFTPTLTGLAERAHLLTPAVNLTTHVADVAQVIEDNGLDQVVLVGHSYGGMVITGVAERMAARIGSIVYLDAFVPEDGQSMADVAPRAPDLSGVSSPPPKAASFNVNAADQAWVDAQLTPHPTASMTEKLRVTGAYKRIPKRVFILAAHKGVGLLDPLAARLAADPGWIVHRLESGHDAMVDKPDELVGLLEASI